MRAILFISLFFISIVHADTHNKRGQVCTNADLQRGDPGCCASLLLDCSQVGVGNATCCNKNSKCIWIPPSATDSSIRNTCHTMTDVDCQATSVDNCVITTKARHKDIVSSTGNKTRCAEHYTGSCSYRCYGGTWYKRANTCKRICYATTKDNCVLPQGTQGDNWLGTCESGYTAHGSGGDSNNGCWYYCNSKGQYDGNLTCLRNSCGSTCRDCKSIYSMRCQLTDLKHGKTVSKSCRSGYTGTCTYTCNDGSYRITSENCQGCHWRNFSNTQLRSMVQPFFSNLSNYPFERFEIGPSVYGTKVTRDLVQRIPEGKAPKIRIKFTCKTDATWETKIQKYNNGWVDVN